MNITFRNAGLKDLPAIVETYNSTIPGRMVTADLEPATVESKTAWFNSHNPKTRPLLVVEYAGQYAGWISYTDFKSRHAYHKTAELGIYLEEKFRGKGLGDACLEYAIEKSPSLNITALTGFIFGHNEPSLKLFYKHGFEKWAHMPQIADMEGILCDLIIVGRKV
ncbi:MAG TPA: GNAT family N-acetyltransferase [Bacteroidia bacterium]|jgi:L-amino acid N-acyltransferase YncA|nr:GNAT family N-acetyltransferase [Bacteroidia bacterium]